jgi:hypothetical protein
MPAAGMEQYLYQNQILFKRCADPVKRISERVKNAFSVRGRREPGQEKSE